jgi:chromosomal replication initiator protein
MEVINMTIQKQIQHLCNLIAGNKKSTPETFEERLKEAITSVTGIDSEVMIARTRKREIVQARQLFHYFMKNGTNLSLAKIGELTGGHDHATVLHSNKTISNLLENNKDIIDYHDRIFKLL